MTMLKTMIVQNLLRYINFKTRSQPMRNKFCQVQQHSNRVMGYRVFQLILCHNNILIGDWQCLRINSKMLKYVGAVRELNSE